MVLRDNLLRLVQQCPVELSNPEDCPLFAVRQARPARRLRWFNDLTEDDLVYLNTYHCICAHLKIQSRSGQNPPDEPQRAGTQKKFFASSAFSAVKTFAPLCGHMVVVDEHRRRA